MLSEKDAKENVILAVTKADFKDSDNEQGSPPLTLLLDSLLDGLLGPLLDPISMIRTVYILKFVTYIIPVKNQIDQISEELETIY